MKNVAKELFNLEGGDTQLTFDDTFYSFQCEIIGSILVLPFIVGIVGSILHHLGHNKQFTAHYTSLGPLSS